MSHHKKFIISFLGSPCSGKSTIAELFTSKFPGVYYVSYDTQKWLLSGFNRYKHATLIKEITFGLLETVCQKGIPIQLQYFRSKEEYEKCVELCQKYGYQLHCIELKAPNNVLLDRFHERVERAKLTGMKISISNEDLFIENLEAGYYVPENTLSFDTSIVAADDIVEQALALVSA